MDDSCNIWQIQLYNYFINFNKFIANYNITIMPYTTFSGNVKYVLTFGNC